MDDNQDYTLPINKLLNNSMQTQYVTMLRRNQPKSNGELNKGKDDDASKIDNESLKYASLLNITSSKSIDDVRSNTKESQKHVCTTEISNTL